MKFFYFHSNKGDHIFINEEKFIQTKHISMISGEKRHLAFVAHHKISKHNKNI
jgi:hypothetical protein